MKSLLTNTETVRFRREDDSCSVCLHVPHWSRPQIAKHTAKNKSGQRSFLWKYLKTSENLATTLLFLPLKHARWEGERRCALLCSLLSEVEEKRMVLEKNNLGWNRSCCLYFFSSVFICCIKANNFLSEISHTFFSRTTPHQHHHHHHHHTQTDYLTCLLCAFQVCWVIIAESEVDAVWTFADRAVNRCSTFSLNGAAVARHKRGIQVHDQLIELVDGVVDVLRERFELLIPFVVIVVVYRRLFFVGCCVSNKICCGVPGKALWFSGQACFR